MFQRDPRPREKKNFWLSFIVWEREQEATKRLVDYSSSLLVFTIYDVLERDKA